MGRGLELLDNVFFGVPGGEGIGVGPFPLALLSPVDSVDFITLSIKDKFIPK